jgi:hypothetical protein
LAEKTIDFPDDNQAQANYTILREDYLTIMEECKPLLKGNFWQFPNLNGANSSKEHQSTMTTEFLRFVQHENLPIFTPEEKKEVSEHISKTLEIFHTHHFYHRD